MHGNEKTFGVYIKAKTYKQKSNQKNNLKSITEKLVC